MGKETKKMLETILSYQEMIMKHLKIEMEENDGKMINSKTTRARKAKVRKMVRR